MKRVSRGEDGVYGRERSGERLDVRERPVARRMHVCEVEHRTDPSSSPGDLEDVVEGAEVAHASHHLDSERHGSILGLEALSERPELLHDRVERCLSAPLEQEARVEDDHLGSAGGCDSGAPVERADGRSELAPARLDVAHEAEERRMDGERDAVFAGELTETLCERVVHPEAALEIDLARCVPALEEQLDRLLRRLPRRQSCRANTDECGHGAMLVPACDWLSS